jgi:hypothetical protein
MTPIVWRVVDHRRSQPNLSFCCRIGPFDGSPGIDAFILMGQQGQDHSGCTLQKAFLM